MIPVQEVIDMDWRKYLEIADYNKDPYKMCEDCIAEQKKKYNGRTPIVCKGLKDYKTAYPEEVLNAVMDNLSEEEKLELKGVFSAPEWFLANVKDRKTFSPRFHQDLVLKCSAKHKVIRMGRRCIAEYEEVSLADGSYKQIKDVVIGDKVFSNRNGTLAENTVLDVIDNGHREYIYEINSESGRTVHVTEDHEILTDVGWKSIKTGLREGSFVSTLQASEFVFSRIKEIRKIEKEVKVYDLTVENDHNFITNGIVTHNCGKTFSVCLDIIHRVETAERPLNILVAAPQLTMINEIERTITLLVNATGKDLIASRKATPTLEIKFFNGSILQGITLSNDGTSARGKRADLIWVDEMDFVNRKALEALQAIEMDNPNVEVIYTSTPIGQGNLYRAENLENTKGFHYPSYVIPHFNDAMYESIKSNLSDIAYAQECFVGSTEVLTTKGPKPIKDITVKDRVYYNSNTSVPVIQNARVTGTKKVVEYFTYSRSFVCTPDHKFPNREQAKVEIQHLSEVPVLRAPYRRYNREEVLARVIGFNIGAGSIDKRACFYSNVREDLKELIADLQYLYPEDGGWLRSKKSASKVDPIRYWLELGEKGTEELIALGCPVGEKLTRHFSLPPFVKNGSDNVKIEFIAGLMGARGTKPARGLQDKYPRMPDLNISETASLTNVGVFFKELESVLESLGISTTLKKMKDKEFNSYRYRIYIRDIILFTQRIGYRYCVSKEADNFKYACYLDYLTKQNGKDTFSEWCSKHVVGDIIFLPIVNTKSKGVQEVYNIGVGSSDHSYLLANNIKTFNCLGLYGLDEAGVFQVHYIEECVNKHIPEVFNEDFVLSNRERFTIFIGVDWNHDLNGTRIVVTAYDKASDRFFVVEKAKIAKQQLTQAIAVDLVVELNRKYQADHICCDEGFGIGQVTELRQRGREQYGKVPHTHPDIKLVDTMSVQFGSSLEIRDPVTHETLKKNTKQYIVENTQKILEQRRLAFDDKEDNDLIMQMKNYVVESSGMRGHKYKPRDKKIGDHDLDAFMLCLYAFDFHFGDYIKPKSVDYGVYLPKQAQYTSPREVASIGLHRKQFRARKRWEPSRGSILSS